MPINNRLLVPQKLPLLLDYAPGAAAAYSLRSLSNSYVGPVVTVRRSTDNAERDFTATEVSDNTLAAWCGGGDGFVKQWWSQTGSNHASQSTAGYQPKIVSSGVLVTEGGKPAVQFDGVNDYLSADITGFRNIQNLTVAIVFSSSAAAQPDAQTATLWGFGDAATSALLVGPATGFLSGEYMTLTLSDPGAKRLGSSTYRRNADETSLLFSTHLQSGTSFYSEGSQVNLDLAAAMTTSTPAAPSNTGYTTNDIVTIGAVLSGGTPVVFTQQKYQELIFYPTDMTALRTRIEGDMAFYY